uniref:NADH:ubiquinone reductase (H(+)-translocating) n=1 Tax=Tetranychus malaysiensis TaxID=1215688 RepID=A0A075X8F0_TETML|nr:NADH dehydrogenase subunit 5 [Tetranychus malaysiensis]AIH15676.1 NADH dehydrogenase subunit 5 [Tetranychus malaysiensis]
MIINLFKILLMLYMMLMCVMMNIFFFSNSQSIIILNEMFFNFNKNITFVLDVYSMGYSLIILIVVINVINFMNIYMFFNLNLKKFFFMTKMFIFSMFLLVYSFNLWTMIVGWEGLGMSSFYLIFYYNNYESWKSAMKTFINNKMGDSLLILSMIFMEMNEEKTKMMFFLILAMLTKSAQFPFMAWLPMAMSAPTPISAMVHSSTLVTAGLFITFRLMNNFFMKMNLNFFMNLCMMSMFVSGMMALMEKDMKKMIALSTLSQISLIFFFLLNNFKVMAFIYMCNHALFKSLMFINMGIMMKTNFSSQLKFNMKNTSMESMYLLSFKMSCFNLMNLSFFSSFFIKEKMLLQLESGMLMNIKLMIFLVNSFLTMNYSLKMIFFFNNNNFFKKENITIKSKNYKVSFFIMNIFSMIFSKSCMEIMLSMNMMNLWMVFFYVFSMLINFKMYKNKFLFINSMLYLNFIMFMGPMKVLNYKLEMIELWMEKLSLNFYFLMKNKIMVKSFNMNYKLILILMLMFMFI